MSDTASQYVYFAQANYGGPIKIGCSYDRDLRAQTLQKDLPFDLVLIGWAPGGFFRERFVQGYFRNYQIRGEWFEPLPELLRWAYQARTTGQIAEMPPDIPCGHTAVTRAVKYQLKKVDEAEIARISGCGVQAVKLELGKPVTRNFKLLAACDVDLYRRTGRHLEWLAWLPEVLPGKQEAA